MKLFRAMFAFGLSVQLLLNLVPFAKACGPNSLEPIFVFKASPDLPFEEFTNGKIGIVQPTFGRKTLVIAYRSLNGGSFTSEEQQSLVQALRGKAPEDKNDAPLKAWVAARKDILSGTEKLPEIYLERQHGGYDFFPNCTKNAFEVATETLKNRVASYGAADQNVRAWLAAQDNVFQNCASGTTIPQELGPENPEWLRKDREYQIGAALFYSLRFDEARARFERIAADTESPWQRTAEYLVARTLVRQGSLTEDETRRREIYKQAEVHLNMLLGRRDSFHDASQKLLALVKYRLHPEERVQELARVLAQESGNKNLRQDLIDYVWLLNKLEGQILKAEEKRKEALKALEDKQEARDFFRNKETKERYEAIHNGELISVTLYSRRPDNTPDYSAHIALDFNSDSSEAQILQAFEVRLGRKLNAEETKDIREAHKSALSYREWLVSPNRKWQARSNEETYYGHEALTLNLIPAVLRADDLTDWIFTFQTVDPQAYGHALSRWRKTRSQVWLLLTLAKANTTSRGLTELIAEAEKTDTTAPAYPTIAYHLVRLKIALGKRADALSLLNEIISSKFETLPISAQNQFIEQRMHLARNLSEFLKSAEKQPVTFYNEGRYGKLSSFMEASKRSWNPEYQQQSKEEYEREVEESYEELLPWDNRPAFDQNTVDILNRHFPLTVLAEAARNPVLPEYLRRQMILAVWTRAILLKNAGIAQEVAPELFKMAPEMKMTLTPYLNARTSKERDYAALYVLLKFPSLSPFVVGGIPTFLTLGQWDYYFETAWWCAPASTEYDNRGNEVPKIVVKPDFLTAEQLAVADREHAALVSLGDGKSFLGKQVIDWAKVSPDDARVPEALFIAARANSQYKYGCNGWDFDQKTKQAAETLLRKRYPRSLWTARLNPTEN